MAARSLGRPRAISEGHYQGREIYAWVAFMGMQYRFDRVVPRSYRHRIEKCELFLEPGLVYVTD